MTFDPVRKRQFWLDYALEYETKFVPDSIPLQGQPLYVSALTNCLVTGYLLGLVDQVRPTLEAVVDWMDDRPEPARGLFSGPRDFWHDDFYALYTWRRTLGLAKWLCGQEGSERHLKGALEAELDCWEQATPRQLRDDGALRRARLGEHLVVALAAGQPVTGLTFYTGAETGSFQELPLLHALGVYMASRLLNPPPTTPEDVEEVRPFLDAGLWEDCLSVGRYIEPALWMKVLFHDSGIAPTPERSLAKLYDYIPGVKRPDFVPR